MLIRFIVSNFMSFKEETEFNMLPASGQKRLKEHIYNAGGIEVLKMGAIYGANGAGKSNLVNAIEALQDVIVFGVDATSSDLKFKLSNSYYFKPSVFKIEFIFNDKVYMYSISFTDSAISEESLFLTGTKDPELIFIRRTNNGITSIEMSDEYQKTEEDKVRIKLYEKDFLQDDSCLLKILTEAKDSFSEIKSIYQYLTMRLRVLDGKYTSKFLTMVLHGSPAIHQFVNDNLKAFNTGIDKLEFISTDINEYFGEGDKNEMKRILSRLHGSNNGVPVETEDLYPPYATLENGEAKIKSLVAMHKGADGDEVKFDLVWESEGTQTLIELLPSFYRIINSSYTLIIDEIESSIHVNLLKELISKFSKDNNTKGQLIFTTHESNLLDQDILRQDEIWFAEKNPAGETGFYPLSDYEIRSDLDIRKGYLNGRFGAIPFLANLHDLNWDKYAKEEV